MNWLRYRFRHILHACKPVEISLADGLAVSIECSSKLYRELSDVEVAVYHAALLEREGVLHEDISLDTAPEVNIIAHDVTLDHSSLTDDDATLGLYLSFESTVDTDVVRRNDLTLDDCSG